MCVRKWIEVLFSVTLRLHSFLLFGVTPGITTTPGKQLYIRIILRSVWFRRYSIACVVSFIIRIFASLEIYLLKRKIGWYYKIEITIVLYSIGTHMCVGVFQQGLFRGEIRHFDVHKYTSKIKLSALIHIDRKYLVPDNRITSCITCSFFFLSFLSMSLLFVEFF